MNKLKSALKILLVAILACVIMMSLTACGQEWVCDECGKSFTGKAYYGMNGSETFCEDCARTYWLPYSYQDYQK